MDVDVDDLLAAAQAGDERARDRLFEVLFRQLHGRLRARVGASDADDLAQATLVVVAQNLATFTPSSNPGAFRGWVFGIARNLLKQHEQRRAAEQRRDQQIQAREEGQGRWGLATWLSARRRLSRVLRAISGMRPAARAALMDELDERDTPRSTENLGTIRMRRMRARKRLRARINCRS